MLNIKKTPTLAALIKGTSAGATHEVWGKRIMAAVGMESISAGFSLTVGRLSATLKTPKYNERRTASAIPVSPQRAGRSTGKSIAESSAYHALPEIYSAGAWRYWQVRCPGQPQGPGSLSLGWGAPCLPLFFIFNSQNNEVSHV